MTGQRGAVIGDRAPADKSTSSVAVVQARLASSRQLRASTCRSSYVRRTTHDAADCLTCVRTARVRHVVLHMRPTVDASRQMSTLTKHTHTHRRNVTNSTSQTSSTHTQHTAYTETTNNGKCCKVDSCSRQHRHTNNTPMTAVTSKNVKRVPGPRDPKKLPEPGFQTTRKVPENF